MEAALKQLRTEDSPVRDEAESVNDFETLTM